MPSGSKAPLPTASLCCGDAEQHDRPDAEGGELGHFLAQALTRVLDDAGQRRDRHRFVDALADEQRGDEVGGADRRLGDEVAQRRRGAQATRTRDGERGHRRHRTANTLATASTTAASVGAAATAATRSPLIGGGLRRALPDRHDGGGDIGEGGALGARPCLDRRAAGEHDGVGVAQHLQPLRVGRQRRGGVGLDGDDVVPGVAQPRGQAVAGEIGLGEQDA